MVSRFRKRLPSHGTVAAYLGLFVALSTGGVYAADKIGSKDIDKNAVTSKHIKTGQVKGKDVAADAIDSSKVGDGTLLGVDFADGQLPAGPQGPQGPKGDTGATGSQGDVGATGPQGLPGMSGYEKITGSSTYGRGDYKAVTLICPGAKRPVFAAVSDWSTGMSGAPTQVAARITGDHRMTVTALADDPLEDWSFAANAVCVNVSP